MTVTNANSQRPARRPLSLSACAIGIALGLYAAGAGALPGATLAMGQSATGAMADPSKRLPGAVTVSSIDFKRGDGGSGKLVLRFDGEGAAPDLRTMGSSVVVDIGNAQLPAALQRPINVTDFATPVQRVDARATSSGAQLVLATQGNF
jgi:type IV pilus assembly protein PilQ